MVLYLQLVKPLQCLDYLTPSTHHKIESLSSLPRTTMWRSCLRPLIKRIKNGVNLKKQIYSNKSMNYLRIKISNKFHNYICNCHSSLIKLIQNEWCWVFSLYVYHYSPVDEAKYKSRRHAFMQFFISMQLCYHILSLCVFINMTLCYV